MPTITPPLTVTEHHPLCTENPTQRYDSPDLHRHQHLCSTQHPPARPASVQPTCDRPHPLAEPRRAAPSRDWISNVPGVYQTTICTYSWGTARDGDRLASHAVGRWVERPGRKARHAGTMRCLLWIALWFCEALEVMHGCWQGNSFNCRCRVEWGPVTRLYG